MVKLTQRHEMDCICAQCCTCKQHTERSDTGTEGGDDTRIVEVTIDWAATDPKTWVGSCDHVHNTRKARRDVATCQMVLHPSCLKRPLTCGSSRCLYPSQPA